MSDLPGPVNLIIHREGERRQYVRRAHVDPAQSVRHQDGAHEDEKRGQDSERTTDVEGSERDRSASALLLHEETRYEKSGDGEEDVEADAGIVANVVR